MRYIYKICSIVRNTKEIEKLEPLVDAFIIPIKDYSINYESYFTLEELDKIKTEKEIFVSINRNIHNNEIEAFKELLMSLNEKNIKGVIFYDIAVINLKNKLKLKYDLVWSQEHLTTNYMTINYWNEKGAKYTYLSSEITIDEIKEIIDNTTSKLFLNVFGHIPIFTSRRHLVNNYIETFSLNKSDSYVLSKEGKTYPITDSDNGTTVYSDYILNALEKVKNLNIDYLVFNPFDIEEKAYLQVIKDFKENKKSTYPEELGFLEKETVYKVKNND